MQSLVSTVPATEETKRQAIAAVISMVPALVVEANTAERTMFPRPTGEMTPGYYVTVNGTEGGQAVQHHALVADGGQVVEHWVQDLGVNARYVSSSGAQPGKASETVTPTPPALENRGEATDAASEVASKYAGDDRTMYSGLVALGTSRSGRHYVLNDTSRGGGIETRDARGFPIGTLGSWFSKEVTDDNDVWGEESDPDVQRSAIDAHYGAQMTYDTYRDILGINSYDLKGGRLMSKVHFGRKVANAFWNGREMRYGDGDGEQVTALTTLDIAGHEITHGLIGNTAKLVYRGEAGALNEGFADIGGFLVEWYAAQKNPNVQWDWKLGEDAWTPGVEGDALRYMDDPGRDGRSLAHYSQYREGVDVHLSSGIVNHAFYQAAATGPDKRENSVSRVRVAEGLGVEKTARIFFRALIHYLRPKSTFRDAREATIRAARELYGADSVEERTIAEAWSVVGVESVNKPMA